MEAQVLVLNRSWVAVQIASARRALSLLYQGIARAVHPTDYSLYDFDNWCDLSRAAETGHFIHTVNFRIRVPEVVLLRVYNGFVQHDVRFSRRNIFERDKNTCQYCGRRVAKAELTIDHVVPRSRGGYDCWENLVLACMACNVRKANRTPEEAHMPLIRKPAKPTWLPQLGARVPTSQLMSWQRFVDTAYWDVELRE
ncbi:MAG TPA: HNH endonuclease [Candidatus Hydrogenedentes bacterium]|nr:HNH endonuclease [Candidatus Hydrogenedentota bacterium]HPC16969.1 HNH endonuclease [Candidatus Hydrogenedentota bacterium]HRT20892.1 HNH endonuclease [Candidatus Hydrogenedentota bacterium]HRT66230.1 HNH endonuclease [Candidatus Hydrogenedentota bacterium]